MSERVVVTLTTGSASPNSAGPRVSRFFITGQTSLGPTDPTEVTSLAEYVATFGPRTGGAAMYDAAEMFLDRAGAGVLVVTRAVGATPVKATRSLEAGDITVTAKNYGAAYNAWTCEYDKDAKVLTVVKGGTTVTYTGADATALQAQALSDQDVDIVVTALPAGDVASDVLAGGTDDFSNVTWATTLATIPAALGPGAVAIPGVAVGTAGSALADHAKDTNRIALSSCAAGTAYGSAVTAAGTAAGYTGAENLVMVYPHVKVSDGAGGLKTIDSVSYAAACRAIAQTQYGLGASPLRRDVGSRINGVTPELSLGTTAWEALNAAHVSSVRALSLGTNLDGWATLAPPSGNTNLYPAQFRDIVNSLAADAADICERYVGDAASSVRLAQCASELAGACETYVPWLKGETDSNGLVVHRGYKVRVDNGANPADNRVSATIAIRFEESAEFIDLHITSADAGTTI